MIACKQSSVWGSWLLTFLPCCLERDEWRVEMSIFLSVWSELDQWVEERELSSHSHSESHSEPHSHLSPLTFWPSWGPDWRHQTDGRRLPAGGRYCTGTDWDTVSVDLEPHYCPAGPESASISGTQSGPHPVIDGSHFLHKKCEKTLIDHGLKCPGFR